MAQKPNLIPPEQRPDFPSMAKATWRDMNNREHKQYTVRANGSGSFMVVNTFNGVEQVEQDHFVSEAAAHEWLRTKSR